MGGGSGAKKKKRGGKKNKSRGPSSKDHHHHHNNDSLDDNDILSEELTVLGATYQDDFKIISESPLQYTINLRPYSKDTGYEDLDASAILSVRCLPGYPYKCPKLKLTPGQSLGSDDANKLLSLLHQQANFAAREGRAMIFNLVEAAKEFLSEIIPAEQPNEPVSCSGTGQADQWISGDVGTAFDRAHSSRGPYVHGLVDLFTGSGESWDWGSVTDKNSGRNSNTLDHPNIGYQSRKEHGAHNEKPVAIQDTGRVQVPQLIGKLDPLKEESGSDSNESSRSLAEESSENEHMDQKVSILQDMTSDDDGSDVEKTPPDLLLSILPQDRASESFKKDLIMVHLLHLACSAKGPLAEALPEITSELHKLGIFPGWVHDLATKPPSVFSEAFNHVFREHMVISPHSQFWNGTSDYGAQTTSLPNSRYLNDFEELSSLGHGGFGHVALCKNKLDGRQYAMKKIRLKDKSPQVNDKILREVATLSRLQHQHVVRYYQAWFETEAGGGYNDMVSESRTASYSSYSYMGPSSTTSVTGPDNKLESTYLYIQMELCPRTLRQVFESYGSLFGKELAWHLFRQIVEGLAHIHAQGIIHRDLTPNNIFFDARNDIKIGDFGLAKFLKLEQLDLEPSFPAETGVSMDGTGQVGTYFYTAPEIEQGWPKIDEKVDMYSLGVVFFELWHPFETAMERHIVLSDLKQKGSLPPSWVADYPEQASILRRLMSPSPSDRPSATELLQSALPPRMEDEWLNDILRTIQSPEDTRVYDRVVQTIFDEQRLISKSLRQHGERVNSYRGDSSFVQYTESETEFHDHVIEVAKEVFRQHNAKRLEITPMRLLDDYFQFNRRNTVKLLTHEGDMLELCHEMRLPFAYWVTTNQKLSFKRYEISWVYRRAIGHSTPNRYLQGDFDIVGGTSPITEALITKVAIDLITRFFNLDRCHIRLNHADLLDAIWSWVGIKTELRESVAQRLSVMSSLRPQSSQRKSSWVFIRRQLLQDLNLPEVVVNRLQTVDLRFCGVADQAVPRLMGALHPDKHTRKALEELSTLLGYLRVWKIEQNVFLDALMPPTESYHHGLYFQVFNEGTLLAVGGRYDHLLHQMRDPEYKTNPPSAVGVSIALETIFSSPAAENKPFRNEATIPVLICSRGGGGLLKERMELVAELWEANIKAEFVPISDPSLTEQYEYANEHDIKCLIIMTETGLSQTCSLKVRHLELKKEKEVNRDDIVKFLVDAAAAQFRNYSIWT